MTIQIQRETGYSQKIAVSTTNNYKIVYGWRKHSRTTDWNIAKTVTPVAGEIANELSEQEASKLPFDSGYISIYYIDPSTGKKTYETGGTVTVVEGTAGTDYTATSTLQAKVPYSFRRGGVAQTGILSGFLVPANDGYITHIYCGCIDAPLGGPITFSITKNSVEIATIILAAGDTSNDASVSLSIAQADIVEAEVKSVGGIESGTEPWVQLDFQAS